MNGLKNSRAPGRWLTFLLVLLRLPMSWLRRRPVEVGDILVLHHLLLGDTLMVTPLLAKLREQYPQARLRMAMPKAFVSLYAGRPYGVEAWPFDPRDVATQWALLRQPRPDLVFLPADNRYSWLARALGARWVVAFAGDKPAWKNWLVDELRPYSATPTAWGDTTAELLDGPRPAPYLAARWAAPPCKTFALPPQPYAVLHLGASTELKLWRPEKWRLLAQQLTAQGLQVVWSAGRGETALVHAVDPDAQYLSYAGQLDLPQLWHLLQRAALLVCPDTGVAHLGRVAGVPTVTLFGPGSALICGAGDFWRDSPYRAVTVADFHCRDQNIQYLRIVPWVRRCERFPGPAPRFCPAPHCMEAVAVDPVVAAVQNLLGGAWAGVA